MNEKETGTKPLKEAKNAERFQEIVRHFSFLRSTAAPTYFVFTPVHKGGIDSLALIVTSMPWERLAAAVVPDQLLVEADGLRLFQGLAAGIEKVSELLRLYGCRTMQGGCTVVCRKWKRLFRSG